MRFERKDIVDIRGLTHPQRGQQKAGASLRGRPWLAVRFKCCSVYSRIYRNRRGSAYEGRCPRCGKRVQARVGANGTSNRFFEAE